MPDREEQRRVHAIRARLTQLATRWPQAEIARRLGTSRTNVSRYLKGTRMPLDVGSAIVEKLGVNPAWLLTGEGAPMLSDVSGATEKTAGDMLALVEAMNQVAQMRLGALTGKHHLRVLRDLNEALTNYERLRARLNKQTVPQFRELQEFYERALMKGDLDNADNLRKSLVQLARLCDNDELARNFMRAQAYHEMFFGDAAQAVELQRRVFHSHLPHDALLDEKSASEAYNFALTLSRIGRLKEARAVCRTALVLAEGTELGEPVRNVLRCEIAGCDARLGQIATALPEFTGAYSMLTDEDRVAKSGTFVLVMYLAGTVDYFGACSLALGEVKSRAMLAIAAFAEDAAALDHACRNFIGTGDKVPVQSTFAAQAVAIRDLLAGRKPPAQPVVASRHESRDPGNDFRGAVNAAQRARLAGDKPAIRRASAHAAGLLEALPAGVAPNLLVLATHHRNLLAAGSKVQRQAAAEYFRANLAAGYGCFRALARAD